MCKLAAVWRGHVYQRSSSGFSYFVPSNFYVIVHWRDLSRVVGGAVSRKGHYHAFSLHSQVNGCDYKASSWLVLVTMYLLLRTQFCTPSKIRLHMNSFSSLPTQFLAGLVLPTCSELWGQLFCCSSALPMAVW